MHHTTYYSHVVFPLKEFKRRGTKRIPHPFWRKRAHQNAEVIGSICLPIVSEFSINSYVENLKKDTLLPTSILRALLEFTQVRTETAAREL